MSIWILIIVVVVVVEFASKQARKQARLHIKRPRKKLLFEASSRFVRRLPAGFRNYIQRRICQKTPRDDFKGARSIWEPGHWSGSLETMKTTTMSLHVLNSLFAGR